MVWFDGDWSEMIIIGRYFIEQRWNDLPIGSGVYRLVALSDSHKPEPLNRVCGVDVTGTLYIGKSEKNLANRIGQLVMSFNHNYSGTGYRKLATPLAKRFSDDRLGVLWSLIAFNDVGQREAQLINSYEETFGEPPPLNRSKPLGISSAPVPVPVPTVDP